MPPIDQQPARALRDEPTKEADVAKPSDARPVRGEPEQLVEAREAILDATPEALVKGRPIPWSAGDMSGYVVPSERQDDGERVCRNIYATTFIGGTEQRQGRPQRWCRAINDTGWAPE